MCTRRQWHKIPVTKLDRAVFGRTVRAFVRRDGLLLVLYRPRSRNAEWHDRINVWAVVKDHTLVGRRMIYGYRVITPPVRWANSIIRTSTTAWGTSCPLVDGRRPTIAESIIIVPPRREELPRTLRRPSCGELDADNSPNDGAAVQVPTMLPTAPRWRTVAGRLARHVLSQNEYDLFVETWRTWVCDYPELAATSHHRELQAICTETVLMFRLQLLGTHRERRLARLYNASFWRLQRARHALGATRRQRLEPASSVGPRRTGRMRRSLTTNDLADN
jgi:hypothetical protein